MCYKPHPILCRYPVPSNVLPYMEWIGEQIHELWAENRMREGWTYGGVYNANFKEHPCLVPYDRLPDSEKEYDRNTAALTIRLLLEAGFQIIPPPEDKH